MEMKILGLGCLSAQTPKQIEFVAPSIELDV